MPALVASDSLPKLALLAGGKATRLRPITQTIPKSMVEVAGEPFIAHQLRLLKREGIDDIVICVGHLGKQIEAFIGDGRKYGCRVSYSYDGERLLGTGGALRQALPLLGEHFFVMYGDSYLDTCFRPVYDAFVRAGKPALMTVFRNEEKWDTSNVDFRDGGIHLYDKIHRSPSMLHIDYGLGIVEAEVFHSDRFGEVFDLADIYRDLVARQLLVGYEVFDRFYEIGSPAGLAETEAFFRRRDAAEDECPLPNQTDGG